MHDNAHPQKSRRLVNSIPNLFLIFVRRDAHFGRLFILYSRQPYSFSDCMSSNINLLRNSLHLSVQNFIIIIFVFYNKSDYFTSTDPIRI